MGLIGKRQIVSNPLDHSIIDLLLGLCLPCPVLTAALPFTMVTEADVCRPQNRYVTTFLSSARLLKARLCETEQQDVHEALAS